MAEIAVIMATYHRPISIKIAIDSVINQTFKNWRLYVVGDNCQDNTADIMAGYIAKHRDKIIWKNLEKNHGGGHFKHLRGDSGAQCRNVAYFMSKEPYIAYLDDDDRYYKNHLHELHSAAKSENTDFAYSKGRFVWSIRHKRDPMIVGSEPPRYQQIGTNAILHSRAFAQRVLIPTKNNDEGLKKILWKPANQSYAAHDWDLIQRMIKVGARYKFVDICTYEAYWGYKQTDFAKMPRIPRYEGVR